MNLTELDFNLPPELIAQVPCSPRDASKLLVLNRLDGDFTDRRFFELPKFLRRGDLLVLNNTKVFPARLVGAREGRSGKTEVFLIREHAPNVWEALVKPGKRIRLGDGLVFGDGSLRARVVEHTPEGRRIVEFEAEGDLYEALERFGQTPLPPYIHRDSPDALRRDRETYQTVYARERGAVAAPTAGLHFTDRVFSDLAEIGVEPVELTLHVGYGTFQPVQTETIEAHRLEGERYVVPDETARRVNAAKREGRRVIAVGTTTVRTLETAVRLSESGFEVPSGSGVSELLIFPGFDFRVIDGLITNFHLPRSSLLALACAFGGHEFVMRAYAHAVESKYRFYSYGDCMALL